MKKIARAAVCALLIFVLVASIAGCKKKSNAVVNDEFAPVSSLVMTEEEAALLNEKMAMTVYHSTKDNSCLVGEIHLVGYGTNDKKLESLVSSIADEVIKGPQNGSVLKSTMPVGTKQVGKAIITGNIAIVNLNKAFLDGLPVIKKEAELVVYSMINSITEIKEIGAVKFLIDGKEVKETAAGLNLTLAYKRNLSVVKEKETIIQPIDENLGDEYNNVPLE